MDVYGGDTDRHASAGAQIIRGEDGRSLDELVRTAAWAILDGVQDAVMEILTEEWPLDPHGAVVSPQVRVDGGRLIMWFGDERAPAIVLPPLAIADVIGGAA